MDAPSNELITDALNKYRSLGVDIQITEMDVSVYPNNSDPEVAWSAALESKQAITYSRFFALFRTYKNDIGGITFWALTDGETLLYPGNHAGFARCGYGFSWYGRISYGFP